MGSEAKLKTKRRRGSGNQRAVSAGYDTCHSRTTQHTAISEKIATVMASGMRDKRPSRSVRNELIPASAITAALRASAVGVIAMWGGRARGHGPEQLCGLDGSC